jgi:seryl-tRNA synthetase
MLDIKFIKENSDLVKMGAKKKRIKVDIDALLAIDDERRKLLSAVEAKRSEQNQYSEKIAKAASGGSNADPDARSRMILEMKSLKESMQADEEKLKEVMKKWQALMVQVPNIPDMTVPEGDDDSANQEVRSWGEPALGDFAGTSRGAFKPKSHIELMETLDLADFERGAKVAGFRGYFLKNDAVMLNFAIWQFTFDHIMSKGGIDVGGGFTPMMVPSLVRQEPFVGTGYLPQSEEDLYKTQDADHLAGTGEVATMGYYMDEVLDKKRLPMKFLAFSPCFRREAGAHGKQTKGIYRVHEFFKFEQVVLCEASHAESVKHHEELTTNAEEILQALKLPYHVVVNCGGDLGLGQVKKYDIEAWIPSEGRYGETHSSSYFHDFQTRRLNIRYKDDDGKMKFVHSLNNTAIASPRILIAILENYQLADGTIAVPDVLQKYMGGKKVISLTK